MRKKQAAWVVFKLTNRRMQIKFICCIPALWLAQTWFLQWWSFRDSRGQLYFQIDPLYISSHWRRQSLIATIDNQFLFILFLFFIYKIDTRKMNWTRVMRSLGPAWNTAPVRLRKPAILPSLCKRSKRSLGCFSLCYSRHFVSAEGELVFFLALPSAWFLSFGSTQSRRQRGCSNPTVNTYRTSVADRHRSAHHRRFERGTLTTKIIA